MGENASMPGPSPPPTPLGCALLALVAAEGRMLHAYEIVSYIADRGGAFGYSESHIYRELRKLAEHGYLEQVKAEVKTNHRPVVAYKQTPEGIKAMASWAASPVTTWPKVDVCEIIPRLRAARVLPANLILQGLLPMRDLLEDQLEDLRAVERQTRRNRKLSPLVQTEFDLQRDLLRTYVDGLDRALSRLEHMANQQAEHSASEAEFDDSDLPYPDRAVLDMEAFVKQTRPTTSP